MNTAPRPVGVTILVVLLWIQAIFGILGGLFLIIEHNDAALLDHVDESAGTINAIGWAALIVGLLTAVVAWAIGSGSNFARWFAGIIAALNLAGGIWSFFVLDGVTRGQALWSILIAFIVLYILFGERGSREFFEGAPPART
jgi:uncharacterized membrane protein (DUF2068 family)